LENYQLLVTLGQENYYLNIYIPSTESCEEKINLFTYLFDPNKENEAFKWPEIIENYKDISIESRWEEKAGNDYGITPGPNAPLDFFLLSKGIRSGCEHLEKQKKNTHFTEAEKECLNILFAPTQVTPFLLSCIEKGLKHQLSK